MSRRRGPGEGREGGGAGGREGRGGPGRDAAGPEEDASYETSWSPPPADAEDDQEPEAGPGPGGPGPGTNLPATVQKPDARPAAWREPGLRPEDVERLSRVLRNSKSENTWEAYGIRWKAFIAWCAERGVRHLPAEPLTVAGHITHLFEVEQSSLSKIELALAGISFYHRYNEDGTPRDEEAVSFRKVPTVRLTLDAIRSKLKDRKPNQKKALDPPTLKKLLGAASGGRLQDVRDRAILLLGFAGAFRREEIVRLDVENLKWKPDGGLVIHFDKSKTNRFGRVEKVAMAEGADPAFCPVRALKDWLAASGIASGPIFRSTRGGLGTERLTDDMVAVIVQRLAKKVGLDPRKFAGHSLRRGLATTARRLGASREAIKRQTRHKTDAMVDHYVEEADEETHERELVEGNVANLIFGTRAEEDPGEGGGDDEGGGEGPE